MRFWRAISMAVYQRVLLAVDLSAESVAIGRRARALCDALGAELHIVTIIEPLPAIAPIPPEPVGPAAVIAEADLLESAQTRIAGLARELGVPNAHWQVLDGNIKTGIVRTAVDCRADLIVLGARERHGLAFLFKPTEDVVLHQAPCDVLAVRLPGG
jgi:universal stress protein A